MTIMPRTTAHIISAPQSAVLSDFNSQDKNWDKDCQIEFCTACSLVIYITSYTVAIVAIVAIVAGCYDGVGGGVWCWGGAESDGRRRWHFLVFISRQTDRQNTTPTMQLVRRWRWKNRAHSEKYLFVFKFYIYWTLRNFFSWLTISSISGWQSRSMMSSSCSSPSVSASLSGLETVSLQGKISFMMDKWVTREEREEKTFLEPEIFTSDCELSIK